MRGLVAFLLREGLAEDRNNASIATAVQRWIQEHIHYLREDPETFATPARTLSWRAGDCDDQTILLCSALRGVKIPCRLVFAGWTREPEPAEIPTRHVYSQAWLGGTWVTLETVKKVAAGWDATTDKALKGYRVAWTTIGDER